MRPSRVLALAALALGAGALLGWCILQPVTLHNHFNVAAPNVKATVIPMGIPLPGTPVAVAGATAPGDEATAGVAGQHLRPGERLLVRHVRHRVAERLQKDGFALVGGDRTPLSPERVAGLMSQLDDEQVIGAAREAGGPELAGGKVIDRLGALVDWFAAHQEQFAAIVKFVMSLLVLFAAQPAGP